MKLKILGSSSSGNCYLLNGKNECLMIEAGINLDEVKSAIDFDIGRLSGCLITHEHKDHSRFAAGVMEMAVDIYTSLGTADKLRISGHRLHCVRELEKVYIGGFTVLPFAVEHDAEEPLGFLIKHDEMGTLLFATDTYCITNRFAGLNHILIECNYERGILDENVARGNVPQPVRDRTLLSHMEMGTCIQFLKENDLTNVYSIVLLHTSRQNGNKTLFKAAVAAATGKQVYVADRGMEIDIDRFAF